MTEGERGCAEGSMLRDKGRIVRSRAVRFKAMELTEMRTKRVGTEPVTLHRSSGGRQLTNATIRKPS